MFLAKANVFETKHLLLKALPLLFQYVSDIISLCRVLCMPPLFLLQVCNNLKQTQNRKKRYLGMTIFP